MNGSNPRWQPGEIQASFGRSAKLYDRAAKSGDVVAVPFGRYLLLERIKRGGMAEVYRAKVVAAEGFEKIVAIKRILPHLAANEDFVAMFIDEAKIVSLLNHQNICPVIELGKCDDGLYIVMEYIWGRDLRQILNALGRSGRLMPTTVAAYVAGRIAEGLDYAHRRTGPQAQRLNIVHRDISPQNILASFDGEVKIIDFGIAHANRRSTQTRVGTFKGKFAYMSPEQARGKDIDRRSDIFSVGILLHEMITGKRLFAAQTDLDTLDRVRNCVVPVPTRPFEEVPEELAAIALRALAREPAERFQWAGELQEALDRFLMHSGELATASRLGNWMCVNFAEQAAKALTDQERAARAQPPGEEKLQPPEEEDSSDESPDEEYISLRGPEGQPVNPSDIGFSTNERPTLPTSGHVAHESLDEEIESFALEGSLDFEPEDEASDPGIEESGAQQSESSYSQGEIVEIPPLQTSSSLDAEASVSTSALQIEYTPWGDEGSNAGADESRASGTASRGGGSGIHVSAGAEDEEEEFYILDSVPPKPTHQKSTTPAVATDKPRPRRLPASTPVESAVAVVEIEVNDRGRETDDLDLADAFEDAFDFVDDGRGPYDGPAASFPGPEPVEADDADLPWLEPIEEDDDDLPRLEPIEEDDDDLPRLEPIEDDEELESRTTLDLPCFATAPEAEPHGHDDNDEISLGHSIGLAPGGHPEVIDIDDEVEVDLEPDEDLEEIDIEPDGDLEEIDIGAEIDIEPEEHLEEIEIDDVLTIEPDGDLEELGIDGDEPRVTTGRSKKGSPQG